MTRKGMHRRHAEYHSRMASGAGDVFTTPIYTRAETRRILGMNRGPEETCEMRERSELSFDDLILLHRENRIRSNPSARTDVIGYADGRVQYLRLPWHGSGDVRADPRVNSGRPSIRGVRVECIVGRIDAGEPVRDVADDYGLSLLTMTALERASKALRIGEQDSPEA